MPLPGLLASALVGRTVPVIASVVLHASVAVGLVASAAGHARGPASVPVAALEIVTETVEAPLLEPVPPPAAPQAQREEPTPPPTHTHPYPVDPSHDARPHDPSLHHEEAVPHHDHDDAHDVPAAEPAPAAPALVADGAAVLPHFTIASGSGAPAGAVRVAANGTGTGAVGGEGPAADDVVVPASSVQVAARLVHSVTAAYPAHARADDVEGDVAVEIVVDRDGRVVEARVTRPAGHGFDDAALAAVRAYRFSPAQRGGKAVRVRMPWSVQFRLR